MKKYLVGFAAFMIVLFSMPLGHAVMIIMEKTMDHDVLFIGALVMGVVGLAVTIWGAYVKKETLATVCGLVGSLLVWTGWIEFCFIYFAHRYHVDPLIVDGEIATKPEYLIMPSSIGFFAVVFLLYLYGIQSKCSFFVSLQRFFKIHMKKPSQIEVKRNKSIVTFMEMIVLLWASYLLLLFVYDDNFLGDRHPVTSFIAFASLAWSAYLFIRLLKIKKIGYAIRYAIPVVIIFWTFVEILGRWDLFEF